MLDVEKVGDQEGSLGGLQELQELVEALSIELGDETIQDALPMAVAPHATSKVSAVPSDSSIGRSEEPGR